MRTPLASPSMGPAPWPKGGGDVPSMALDDEEAAALQKAIEESLGDDMKRRLQSSLQSTEQELWNQYPEEANGTRDIKRARLRSSSDLEVAVSEAPTGRMSIRASPTLGPSPAPRAEGQQGPAHVPGTPAPASPEVGPAPDQAAEVAFTLEEEVEADAGPAPAAAEVEAVAVGDGAVAVESVAIPRSTYEFEGLLDHELLLETLYAEQGLDLRAQQDHATRVLAEVGLRALDLGVKNWDEEGRELMNQCFYLSLARSYLGPLADNDEFRKAALLLKRTVEACVLAAHPEWATDNQQLGENAMAFADFLPVAMAAKDPPNLVARLAVLIMDTTQGNAEVYLGPQYAKADADGEEREREELEQNLVLLCYTPGHYKALVQDDAAGSKPAWTYSELKGLLDQRGVMLIETSDFD